MKRTNLIEADCNGADPCLVGALKVGVVKARPNLQRVLGKHELVARGVQLSERRGHELVAHGVQLSQRILCAHELVTRGVQLFQRRGHALVARGVQLSQRRG